MQKTVQPRRLHDTTTMIVRLDGVVVHEALLEVRQKHFWQDRVCTAVKEVHHKVEHLSPDDRVESSWIDLRLGGVKGPISRAADQRSVQTMNAMAPDALGQQLMADCWRTKSNMVGLRPRAPHVH